MDYTVCIWNVWSGGQKQARVFDCHQAAVKDVTWSQEGLSVLSCGYDCTSRLVDVEKGMVTRVFKEDQIVEVVKFCPTNCNLFLSGGSKGLLKLWDVRTGTVVNEYVRRLGPILDVEFTFDGKHLITSSDVSKSNLSENSIIVWDVSRQVPLSNQKPTHAPVSDATHLSHTLLLNPMQTTLLFSVREPPSNWTSTKGKWLGSRQIRCNWAPKGAGTSDDKQGSDSKSVVELIDGSSEDVKEAANSDAPENNP
ncbi:hypothetical protein ACS0TY_001102 [Phlomoides rotata]